MFLFLFLENPSRQDTAERSRSKLLRGFKIPTCMKTAANSILCLSTRHDSSNFLIFDRYSNPWHPSRHLTTPPCRYVAFQKHSRKIRRREKLSLFSFFYVFNFLEPHFRSPFSNPPSAWKKIGGENCVRLGLNIDFFLSKLFLPSFETIILKIRQQKRRKFEWQVGFYQAIRNNLNFFSWIMAKVHRKQFIRSCFFLLFYYAESFSTFHQQSVEILSKSSTIISNANIAARSEKPAMPREAFEREK